MSRFDRLTPTQNMKHDKLSDWCECNRDACDECPFYCDIGETDTTKFHWCHCDAFNTDEELAIFIDVLDKDYSYYLMNLKDSDNANEVIYDKETPSESNAVDHPSHYNQGGIECIDAMVSAFGADAVRKFCLINAFKYIWRASDKNGDEDIDKAIWYLNKYGELNDNE